MKSRLKTLTSFLDESDILRVGGRIDHAAVCYDAKYPMIIPQDHQLCHTQMTSHCCIGYRILDLL